MIKVKIIVIVGIKEVVIVVRREVIKMRSVEYMHFA